MVRGTGKTVALIGDSHGQMLMAPMVSIARAESWTLAVVVWNGCPWQDGLWRFSLADRTACLERKADLRTRIMPRLDPDIVVLIHAPLDREGLKGLLLGGPNGRLATGSPEAERAIEAATAATVARLTADDRDVVIIEPIPQAPRGYDPLGCLSTARFLDQCRFVVNPLPSPTELYYRKLARSSDRVFSLDIDRLACPYLPICDPMVRGKIVWSDLSHLSNSYARTLAQPIRELFTAQGIGSG